jgi:DNA-binding transcriptional regulator YbjK
MARLKPAERRSVIVTAIVRVAFADGLHKVNHGTVASRCSVQTSKETVKKHFPLQRDMWAEALMHDDEDASLALQAVELSYVKE